MRVQIPKTPPAMSAVGAVAANIGPTGPVSLQVQSDPALFLDSVCWLQLLQDDGKEMTCEKVSQYLEPTKGKKQKKKYKTIAHGGFLSRAVFTSRQCLGIVGDNATRIFPTSSSVAKKYVKYHSHYR